MATINKVSVCVCKPTLHALCTDQTKDQGKWDGKRECCVIIYASDAFDGRFVRKPISCVELTADTTAPRFQLYVRCAGPCHPRGGCHAPFPVSGASVAQGAV